MRFNPLLEDVPESPISEAYSWVGQRVLGDESQLVDVSQAVPGYPPPPELRQHIAELTADPMTYRYTDQMGLPELREATARDMSRSYASGVDPDQVAITAGCNQAFCLTVAALAREGDEIIVPLPFYFNHDMWLRASGVRAVYLDPTSGLEPDPERAEALISSRTRAILLVSPNNPSGSTLSPESIEAFFDLARRHDIALVLDETYRDFRQTTEPAHQLFDRPGWDETLVHLYSFSKVFCLTGHRVGALATRPTLIEQIAKAMDCVAICPPHLGQRAALYGLEHLGDWREQNRQAMVERVARFSELVERSCPDFAIASSGAYFAYVEHPFSNKPAREVARQLAREHGVLCLSGDMFGPRQESYLRLAFANLPVEDLPELCARLSASRASG